MKSERERLNALLVQLRDLEAQRELIETEEREVRAATRELEERVHLERVDAYLELVPLHSYTSCDDTHRTNTRRCDRCLEAKADAMWPDYIASVELVLSYRRDS